MSEQEQSPYFKLQVGNEELIARPDNASLYTFIGKSALNGALFENSSANHIFFQRSNQDDVESPMGKFVFISEETVEKVIGYMAMNGYRCILNMTEITQGDMEAYQQFVEQQVTSEEVPDTMPEDWQ